MWFCLALSFVISDINLELNSQPCTFQPCTCATEIHLYIDTLIFSFLPYMDFRILELAGYME